MNAYPVTAEQRSAAKLAGALYVIQMAAAIFAHSYIRGRLIVRDAAQTAANITGSETLFRVSIVTDLLIYATVIVLAWAVYVILKPVRQNLSLLALLLRVAENAILAGGTLLSFAALRLAADADSASLARVILGVHGIGLGVGFIFTGIGSAIFSYIWLKSRYIPPALAILGIVASLLLAGVTLARFVVPAVSAIGLAYMVPMFLYEVGLGLWLLVKGLREY
jgi:Domain of unknown function (DUF4386)